MRQDWNMDLSIIMPTYNNLQRLKITLSYLEKQDLEKTRFNIFIVNDGSSDGTREFLDSYKSRLDLHIIHQENKGQASARNKALALADGMYVLFIDDDVVVEQDFVRKHLLSHQNSGMQSLVTVGQINNIPFGNYEEAIKRLQSGSLKSCYELSDLVKVDEYLNIRNWVWDYNLEYAKWLGFTTANASMSRQLLIEAGGFDEKFYGWGPEDVELGYRLLKKGAIFQVQNELVNYHLDKVKKQDSFYSGLNKNLRYLREEKYPDDQIIWKYIIFIGGKLSIEEFNAFCSDGAITYKPAETDHFFKFIRYFTNKV
jgi:glycosyltransferase involved in cell wall biosynthesis